MSATVTGERFPTSIVCVILVGLPLVILSESTHPGYYPKLFLFQAGITVLACLVALRPGHFKWTALLLPAVLFLLTNILSVAQSINRIESIVVLTHRIGLLSAFVLIISALKKRDLAQVASVVGVSSTLIAIIGIGQYAGWFGLQIPSSGMPSATLGYRNFAAAYVIAAIPFVLFSVLRHNGAQRYLWTALLFLNGAFLLATRTRAAWFACVLSGLAALLVYIWRIRTAEAPDLARPREALAAVALAVATSVAFSLVVPPDMAGRGYDRSSREKETLQSSVASTFQQGADKNRFTMWRNTLEMVAESPLQGVGLGNWQFVYPDFDRGEVTWKGATPRRPHNDYLWIVAETGLPGLLIFGWCLVVFCRLSARALKNTSDPDDLLLVLAALASLLAVAVHGIFSFPLERIPVTFLGVVALSTIVLHDPQTSTRLLDTPRRLTVYGLVVVGLLSGAVAWRAVAFDRLSFRQLVAVERGDWRLVADTGTQALTLGVFDPQVLLLRGLAHHERGDYDAAIDDQEACLSYHPYLVNAINNLGMSLIGAGRFDEAEDVLGRIADLNPDHVEVHLNLARAYTGQSRGDVAIRELEVAHQKAPNRTDILSELTRQYERAGNLARAAEASERAVALKPERPDLHYRLGVIRQKQGNLREAATHFRRVLQLNRDHIPVLYNLGELYLARGDTANAIQAYEAFLSRWKGPSRATEPVRRKLESLR